MLKSALRLWKKEQNKKGTTLHRRLLLFFMLAFVSLILAFVLLMSVFDLTGRQDKAVQNHLSTELSIIADKMDDDFGRASLGGIEIAEDMAKRSNAFFSDHSVAASQLKNRTDLIEPLLAEQMQTLIATVNNRYCGGAFIMLDASVTGQDGAKAGVFLKKTQPTATDSLGVKVHYLRGPASLARDNGIMLLGQWKMEFDTTDQAFFDEVMETARNNPGLPLSRLYYWSGRVTLKGNSEAGFLLCVPLIGEDGFVFGLCGVEISDRLFKSFYTPEGGTYDNIFTVMAPNCSEGLCTKEGMIAGNYYLTGKHWQNNLTEAGHHDGFIHYTDGTETYGGKQASLHLYPENSPYKAQEWSAAVLMPKSILHSAVSGSIKHFILIVFALLLLSAVASLIISRRYIKPVHDALHSIKNTPHQARENTKFLEINDLFEFLAAKDKEHEAEVDRLNEAHSEVKSQYEQAQTYIANLADSRMPEVDKDDFELFLSSLETLTTKDRSIFNLYLEGNKAKEILELAGINQNTLKYHNKNIYSKLGVTSRKQLLEFAALMKYAKEKEE